MQKKPFPFHVFLFALSPILALFAHNIDQIELELLARPLVVALVAASALWLLSLAVFRDTRRAGVVTFVIVVPFFSVEHFASLVAGSVEGNSAAATAMYAIWAVLFIASVVLLIRTKSDLVRFTTILNLAAAVLVAIPAVRIMVFEIQSRREAGFAMEASDDEAAVDPRMQTRPNIYYLLLDGYGRSDVLEYLFEYDNSEFIEALKQRGFYVAQQSCSNYAHTMESISSTLNFDYIGRLLKRMPDAAPRDENASESGSSTAQKRALALLFARNRVVRFLKKRGYRYVAFDTGFWSLEGQGVDVAMRSGGGFNLFENQLINTTPVAGMLNRLPVENQYDQHRRRILYTLEHLGDTAALRGPLFVFAHIIVAHPPFVFDELGNPIQPARPFAYNMGGSVEEYATGYTHQVEFINHKVIDAIDAVLAGSEEDPIIIVNGDHGSRVLFSWESALHTNFSEVFPILNAYHLPGPGTELLYEGISPVNSFRVVFNSYFGTTFKILKDRSFYSSRSEPNEFHEVTRDKIVPSMREFARFRELHKNR